jgi:hypothetical protein
MALAAAVPRMRAVMDAAVIETFMFVCCLFEGQKGVGSSPRVSALCMFLVVFENENCGCGFDLGFLCPCLLSSRVAAEVFFCVRFVVALSCVASRQVPEVDDEEKDLEMRPLPGQRWPPFRMDSDQFALVKKESLLQKTMWLCLRRAQCNAECSYFKVRFHDLSDCEFVYEATWSQALTLPDNQSKYKQDAKLGEEKQRQPKRTKTQLPKKFFRSKNANENDLLKSRTDNHFGM